MKVLLFILAICNCGYQYAMTSPLTLLQEEHEEMLMKRAEEKEEKSLVRKPSLCHMCVSAVKNTTNWIADMYHIHSGKIWLVGSGILLVTLNIIPGSQAFITRNIITISSAVGGFVGGYIWKTKEIKEHEYEVVEISKAISEIEPGK